MLGTRKGPHVFVVWEPLYVFLQNYSLVLWSGHLWLE